MRRRPRSTAFIGTARIAATMGCAMRSRITCTAPTIALVTVDVRALTQAMAIHNTNPYHIAGKELTGDVTLEDIPFGSVARPAPWMLPANADTVVTIRLDFGWSAVGAAARALSGRGRVRCTMQGEMLVGTAGEVPLARRRP